MNTLPSSSKHVISSKIFPLLNLVFVDVESAEAGTVKPVSLKAFLIIVSVIGL